MFFTAISYLGTVRTWAEEINSKASYRNILNTQRWQNWKINKWSESSKRRIFQPRCPQGWGISQADVSSHRTSWTHYRQPRHPQLPIYTVHSQISPVREFNAAITFFSVATTNFLDPGENSKEANLSFPTYCCLLKERGQGNGRGQCHCCTGHFGKKTTAQIQEVITVTPVLGCTRNVC